MMGMANPHCMPWAGVVCPWPCQLQHAPMQVMARAQATALSSQPPVQLADQEQFDVEPEPAPVSLREAMARHIQHGIQEIKHGIQELRHGMEELRHGLISAPGRALHRMSPNKWIRSPQPPVQPAASPHPQGASPGYGQASGPSPSPGSKHLAAVAVACRRLTCVTREQQCDISQTPPTSSSPAQPRIPASASPPHTACVQLLACAPPASRRVEGAGAGDRAEGGRRKPQLAALHANAESPVALRSAGSSPLITHSAAAGSDPQEQAAPCTGRHSGPAPHLACSAPSSPAWRPSPWGPLQQSSLRDVGHSPPHTLAQRNEPMAATPSLIPASQQPAQQQAPHGCTRHSTTHVPGPLQSPSPPPRSAATVSSPRGCSPSAPSGPHMQQWIAAAGQQPPCHMQLSVPELEAAAGHALGIYGDIDHYLGSLPLQTHYTAILKFSGVPEQDVLLAVWRSQTFQPAHYVARDVARSKLVICIRGTMEATDTITDLASRPQHASFGPGLQGSCHSGMLQAAQWVLASVEQEVLVALQAQPCLDLMVTGHSMGGGIAALLALMLRHDPRLSMRTRSRLRAVCLAPAAVLGHSLAVACRDFVVSVINNNDLVPRVSIHSLSTFVRQVAAASPLQQAMAALARLMCGSAPRDSATATPGSSPGALATPSPAPHQLATNSQAKLSAAPLQTTLQSLPPKSELATLMSEFSSAQMPETGNRSGAEVRSITYQLHGAGHITTPHKTVSPMRCKFRHPLVSRSSHLPPGVSSPGRAPEGKVPAVEGTHCPMAQPAVCHTSAGAAGAALPSIQLQALAGLDAPAAVTQPPAASSTQLQGEGGGPLLPGASRPPPALIRGAEHCQVQGTTVLRDNRAQAGGAKQRAAASSLQDMSCMRRGVVDAAPPSPHCSLQLQPTSIQLTPLQSQPVGAPLSRPPLSSTPPAAGTDTCGGGPCAPEASAQYLPRAPGGSCATALLEPLLPPGTVLWLLPEQPSLLQRMAALAKHHQGRRGQPALAPEPTRRPAPALTTPPSHHSDSSNPGKGRLQRGEATALQETACVRRVREGAEHVEKAAVTCRSKPTKGGEDEEPQAGQEGRQRLATCSHGAGDASGAVGNPQRSMWQWARSWAVRASESMGRQPAARQQQARGPGARLVLVVTEPDAFQDILFFSSAVADHMPTSYHKVRSIPDPMQD
ncbi:hypothetical protein V8C86DRAFT_2737985 [Haematococcus lacustris]